MLRVDSKDGRPIWRQIEDQVRLLVTSRIWAAGDSVPSVRDLAKELRVNPATVSKAYQRLADTGLLVVKRGQGTFVCDSPPVLDANRRAVELDRAAGQLASTARSLGASLPETHQALTESWNELGGTTDGAVESARRAQGGKA